MDPNEVELIYELSPMQQAMLFHSLYAPGSGVYILQLSLRLSGRLDIPAFERAWQSVVERHGILRTGFFWEDLEKPLQVVYRQASLEMIRSSWRGLGAEEQRARLQRHLDTDREQGFDLAVAPLMRLALFELDEGVHELIWTQHHLVIDGWSQGRLLQELFTAYAELAAGREPRLERPGSFRDYISWLQRQDAARTETFWRRTLAGFTSPTFIAGDARPADPTWRESRQQELRLPTSTGLALRELARRCHVTLGTLVQGAWGVVLARLTGREDVVFGTTVSGRPPGLPGVESTIGPFINTLPTRLEVPPERRLQEWITDLQQQLVEMRGYEHSPLVDVQRWSELPRGTALFDHILVFENAAVPSELAGRFPDLEIAEDGASTLTNYAFNVVVIPGAELRLSVLYDTGSFADTEVGRILERLAGALTAFAADPAQRLEGLSVLLPAERHQIAAWNETGAPWPGLLCLHELFAAQVQRTPQAVALVHGTERWTYAELAERAGGIARHLRGLGVGPEVRVAVCLERSPDLIAALLGVLAAGGAYVPVDPAYPLERRILMLEDSASAALITRAALAADLPAGLAGMAGPVHVLDLDATGIPAAPLPSGTGVVPDHLAYVIFTSGSTGRPKGVAIEHRSAVALALWASTAFRADDLSGMLAATSVCFDLSVFEIFVPLAWGGKVLLAENALALPTLPAAGEVRLLNTVPSAAAELVRTGLPPSVRTVCLAGEPLPGALVARLYETGTVERVYNLYGPSEDTTYSTGTLVPRGAESPSIGRPLPGTRAWVVDRRGNPVPVGAAGELWLAGDGLARGYLGRPELTAERFTPDPFAGLSEGWGERVYRTGDLVRHRPHGQAGLELEFLGRIDHQVKIRGFRIELGEIEAALASHPAVHESVVVAREDVPGSRALVAYVVQHPGSALADPAVELRAFLGGRLPEHMVPTFFVPLEALPRTANGKLDRRALPAPERPVEDEAAGAPTDPVEEMLAGIWAEVLGLERVGIHDSFFALGGHSLLATQVVSRVRSLFGVELPLRRLFEAQTVAGLAKLVWEELQRDEGAPAGPDQAPPEGSTGTIGAGRQAPPLVPVPRGRPLPLSFAQQRLWLIDQLDPGNPAYNIPLAVRLTGRLPEGLLERVFTAIIDRHEALRTTFATQEDVPVQVIAPRLDLELPVLDLSHVPEAEREARAFAAALEEARRPFDLRTGPLLRLRLVRLGAEDHLLLVTMHHIVSDGWSMGVLVREIAALAEAAAQGRPAGLPELPVQYADFAVWQRRWLQGEVLEEQLAAWRSRLAGAPHLLELPTDRPRPAVQTSNGAALPVTLPAALSTAVQALSQREGATPFMTLLAVWALLLGRHAGTDDVLVGTPIAGRNRQEIEGLIGFFVNTLVLRSDLSGDPTFAELLGRVRQTAFDAFTHQDLPFERIVEEVEVERDLSVSPLFQALFALQNAPAGDLAVPGLALSTVPLDLGLAKFDLSLVLQEGAHGFAGTLGYNADLFDRTTQERRLGHFRQLLAAAVAEPGRRLRDLPLLAAAERHQVLAEWSGSGRVRAQDNGRVQGLFPARAARAPEAVALVAGGAAVTYGELAERAGRMSRRLIRRGVGPEVIVGVCLADPAEIVTAFLAVLETGGAFLPLDPGYPEERRRFVLEDARAALVVTRLDEWLDGPADGAAAAAPCLPENLAYVIYTSGTTGQPKGVAITQQTLASMLAWGIDAFGLGEHTRTLLNLAPWFDFGVFEILTTLLAGGTLHIPQDRADASRHGAYLREHRIDTLHSTPSFFREVLAAGEALPDLEVLHLGGEALHQGAVQRIFDAVGERCRLYNGYGPTEATINCALFDVGTRGDRRTGNTAAVPIGRATARHRIYVLDRSGEPSGIGIPGELCVGGGGLARGYLNRPGLTADRFLPDPFSGTPGARLYRTGDLVRSLPGGDLEFLGRIDQQVKLRGLRIELGEIETVLAAHPGVREVVAQVREDRPGDQRLVAYAVCAAPSAQAAAPLAEELRRLAAGRLPAALVPSAFVFLDAFPRTVTGKIDRKALPAPEPGEARQTVAPRTPTEQALVEIWKELLGLEQVGVEDDFFQLGGHSLLATQALSRVRSRFGVELPLRDAFERPTVSRLAELIDERPAAPADEEDLAALLDELDGLSDDEVQARLEGLRVLEKGS